MAAASLRDGLSRASYLARSEFLTVYVGIRHGRCHFGTDTTIASAVHRHRSPNLPIVKRTKVDTFVLVKLFLQLPRAEAIEENPFKSMAYHLIEVKMFSSVGNKPNLANMTSRLYSRSCVALLKKVLGISKLPKSWGKRQGMRDNNFTSTSTTIATLLQLELK